MRKTHFLTNLLAVLIISCQTNQKSLKEQLADNLSGRIKKTDSLLTLDSFRIVKIDSITEKMGEIITDTIFSRERSGLENQLNSARKDNKTDSVEFVQYEINYMNKEIDSITSKIKGADTAYKYGILAICSYTISKNNKSKNSLIYYFINTKDGIVNSDMINDNIKAAANELR